jgi:hypothetical protein
LSLSMIIGGNANLILPVEPASPRLALPRQPRPTLPPTRRDRHPSRARLEAVTDAMIVKQAVINVERGTMRGKSVEWVIPPPLNRKSSTRAAWIRCHLGREGRPEMTVKIDKEKISDGRGIVDSARRIRLEPGFVPGPGLEKRKAHPQPSENRACEIRTNINFPRTPRILPISSKTRFILGEPE